MDTRLLTNFLDVVQAGGFAAAARHLEQDPSSISRSIAALEHELGVRLFQRTTRKMSLTEAGRQFAARVEPLLAELDHAREEVQSERTAPRGRLSVSTSVAFGQICVMPHVAAFCERYPEIQLDLKFTDRNVDLVAERVDLAVRLGPSVDADVVASRLMTTRYRVCASPDYVRHLGRPSEPAGLAALRCICFDLPEFKTQWRFRAPSSTLVEEVTITPRMTLSGALAVRDAALAGLGPALLADWLVARDLNAGALIDLFPHHAATATTFETAAWLLYPSRSFLPVKTRVMADYLREHLGHDARLRTQPRGSVGRRSRSARS